MRKDVLRDLGIELSMNERQLAEAEGRLVVFTVCESDEDRHAYFGRGFCEARTVEAIRRVLENKVDTLTRKCRILSTAIATATA